MNKILSLILVMIAVALPMTAQESSNGSSTRRVGLEISQTKGKSTVLRAPMRIDVQVYYYEEDGNLEVCYDGESTGEVFLYLNDTVIGYNSEINSSFQISDPGCYKIEIVGETWMATGYLQL